MDFDYKFLLLAVLIVIVIIALFIVINNMRSTSSDPLDPDKSQTPIIDYLQKAQINPCQNEHIEVFDDNKNYPPENSVEVEEKDDVLLLPKPFKILKNGCDLVITMPSSEDIINDKNEETKDEETKNKEIKNEEIKNEETRDEETKDNEANTDENNNIGKNNPIGVDNKGISTRFIDKADDMDSDEIRNLGKELKIEFDDTKETLNDLIEKIDIYYDSKK